MSIKVIQPGAKIYHGTENRIKGGIPNRPSGSWFSTNRNQSVYHAMAGIEKQRVLYEYTVIKPMRIISFDSIPEFNKWALGRGHVMNPEFNSFVFGAGNIAVAAKMCNENLYDGWALPTLQRQIMICKPKNFLQLSQVYLIRSNANSNNIEFPNKANAAGNILWRARAGTTYNLQPVKINNIENLNEPRANQIYWYLKNRKTPVFINSIGTVLARGMNSLVMNNSKHPTAIRTLNNKLIKLNLPTNGSLRNKLYGNNLTTRQQKTLRNRGHPNASIYTLKIKKNNQSSGNKPVLP